MLTQKAAFRMTSNLASLLTLLAACPAPAAPLAKEEVPQPLAPWVQWVLAGREASQCPFLQGSPGERPCAWPAALSLSLEPRGGTFSQRWRLYSRAWLALPGDEKVWPQEVSVDGAPAAVVLRNGRPHVQAEAGEHRVAGSFAWASLPELLQVPPETGVLSLTVSGKAGRFPNRDREGRLWLQREQKAAQAESRLEVVVHRKVVDDIPLRLVTRVQLKVSGKGREAVLGKALPHGFIPMSLEGPLPSRVETDGRLRVQVRPGAWDLELTARHEGPVQALDVPKPEGTWDEDEVWVFEARNELRQVSVEGLPSLDPSQTELPAEWKRLPAYLARPGSAMRLVERRRGDADPAPDSLSLDRSFWLDFDGGGLSVRDKVSGTLTRSWRLDMGPTTRLGRAAIQGADQFITSLKEGGPAGVEVRQGQLDLEAESRVEGRRFKVPAVSWSAGFQRVSARLNLPAGWRLWHVSGADEASPTWLSRWTLLDFFLVLILTLSVGRLWDRRWAAAALAMAALTWHEDHAMRLPWLFLLASEALVRVLPEGRFSRFMSKTRLVLRGLVLILAIPFVIYQVRDGLYPHLRPPWGGGFGLDLPLGELASEVQGEASAVQTADLEEEAGERYDADEAQAPVQAVRGARQAKPSGPAYKYAGGKSARISALSRQAAAMAQGRFQSQANLNILALDPKSQVSTGPGIPSWKWHEVELSWKGPVDAGHGMLLWLTPPWFNFLLGLVRIALVLALALFACGFAVEDWLAVARRRLDDLRKAAPAGIGALLLAASLPAAGRAEMPSQELLNELRNRLLENPECFPECAQIGRMRLEASPSSLRARLSVSAAAQASVPLPGGAEQWSPDQVLVDGSPASGLLRSRDGRLWLPVRKGAHQVVLEGALPDRESVQIPLPLKPRRVEASVAGWVLDGVNEDGVPDDTLQLTRALAGAGGAPAAIRQGALQPFAAVERTVRLGLSWQVETRVVRLTPPGAAIVLELPLLPGESVTSPEVRVLRDNAQVSMGPQAGGAAWLSVLKEAPVLPLKAPRTAGWTEVWRLDAAPVWHAEPSGIPAVHRQPSPMPRVREWRPWPGEEVSIAVSRPKGVPGQTLTIDRAALSLTPGLRASDAALDLAFRASRGGQHVVILPEAAELESASLDGSVLPVRQEGSKVVLPVTPGAHKARLAWRQKDGIRLVYRTPQVDIGAPAVNADISVGMPKDRWTLLVGGPRTGPVVLFWSLLAAFLVACVGLGHVPLTPLRTRDWFLLSLGLTQVGLGIPLFIAAWLLMLGWRKDHFPEKRWRFNLDQAALALATLAALGCIVYSISHGLLGLPDMQIGGNGSHSEALKWYQDRTGQVLPRAWAFSVPLMLYRCAMLAWALWLAGALIGWLKWGWSCYASGGLWRDSAG